VFVFSVAFISMEKLFTAIFSGIEVAQAAISLLIPILFLFGGLFARYPTLPAGWRWMYWADPIHYALEALVAPIFYCEGPSCPTLTFVTPDGVQTVDTLAYVEESFGISYGNRWLNVGYLCIFIAGLQVLHFIALRYVSHIKR